MKNYETDLVIPKGNFTCLPSCGYCCHYVVELRNFDKPDSNIAQVIVDGEFAQSKLGRCVFLKDNMQCSIYDHRPSVCRIYPFNVHISDRIQISSDLSCPGLGKGSPVEVDVILSLFPHGYLEDRLNRTNSRWIDKLSEVSNGEFDRNAINKYALTQELHKGHRYLPALSEYSARLDECRLYPRVIAHNKVEILTLIYYAHSVSWHRYPDIKKELTSFRPEDPLDIPIENTAYTYLDNYAAILLKRDSVLGYALRTYDKCNGRFSDFYIGLISDMINTVTWEAGAIAMLEEKASIDSKLIEKAIRFYDHVVYTLPTFGEWG